MKKLLATFLCGSLLVLGSCGEDNTTTTPATKPTTSISTQTPTSVPSVVPTVVPTTTQTAVPTAQPTAVKPAAKSKVFLAGDSTVKTYNDNQFIGGWGQYLDLFLEDIEVYNCANGGRSSRSFINEGRLYNIEDSNFSYTFSENKGASIEDSITAGDYLFIQFGHNDDDTKMTSSYTTIYDRMVPLGTPDSNGIYPVTPATRVSTTTLPTEYTNYASDSEENNALTTIAKYGSTYYAYNSGGTYKWYLKQYIDFARSKGATPVLVTPVARVKFSGSEIIGGAGLHGDNFAYVQAVRQLANEEGCLLIDLFEDSKIMLETATPTYANYLMALKPNDIQGTWPATYDETYGVPALGYTGIEATHYNKYGAYLQAAKVAEHIKTLETSKNGESFNFKDSVLSSPKRYIDPSNLMSKSKVNELEALFTTINVTNPNRQYKDPQTVVTMINNMVSKGIVTNDNYLDFQAECEKIRAEYVSLNIDDRGQVTNLSNLEEYEKLVNDFVIANRPVATKTVILCADDVNATDITSAITCGEFTIVGSESKQVNIKPSASSFTYNDKQYTTTKGISLGGSATFGTTRYIEFNTTGKCTITVVAKSTGSSDRVLNIVDSNKTTVGSAAANQTLSITTLELEKAGTYQIGSAGSAIYIYYIIIEYFE